MPTVIIDVDAAATDELVAGVAGTVYVVESFVVTNTGGSTGSVQFKSATTGISGNYSVGAAGNVVRDWSPSGHFRTTVGEALQITAATVNFKGDLVYRIDKG